MLGVRERNPLPVLALQEQRQQVSLALRALRVRPALVDDAQALAREGAHVGVERGARGGEGGAEALDDPVPGPPRAQRPGQNGAEHLYMIFDLNKSVMDGEAIT